MELVDAIVGMYNKVATELPSDVLNALKRTKDLETKGTASYSAMDTILENIELAKNESKPMCQDTGTPIFYVKVGKGMPQNHIRKIIIEATKRATKEIPLRPNAVDSLTGKNSGDNTGIGIPIIYFEEWDKDYLFIQLMLKGGGSENICRLYKLPNTELGAGRDLEGIKKCVIDAVFKAQGEGCPPGIVGVGIGGTRAAACKLSARQLLRTLTDKNQDSILEKFENEMLEQLNSMGIGPMGLGGKTAVLGVKAGAMHRHPASFFVDVSFFCWAARRGSLEYENGEAKYG